MTSNFTSCGDTATDQAVELAHIADEPVKALDVIVEDDSSGKTAPNVDTEDNCDPVDSALNEGDALTMETVDGKALVVDGKVLQMSPGRGNCGTGAAVGNAESDVLGTAALEPRAEQTLCGESSLVEDITRESQGNINSLDEPIVDERPRVLAGAVHLNEVDTTINVIPFNGASGITSLSEGGFQYLLAGVRANTGIKAGKYMFEVKILEHRKVSGSTASRLSVGFSAAGSSLLLGHDTSTSFIAVPNPVLLAAPGVKELVVLGVLLDRDNETMSVFRNGLCVLKARTLSLPATLQDKALYPTITYKNLTLQVNFGPSWVHGLSHQNQYLQNRMVGEAAEEDVEIACPLSEECVVLFPVGLPNNGMFAWIDDFLKNNPCFTELSDRMLVEWLKKSLGKNEWPVPEPSSCIDKPNLQFNVPNFSPQTLRDMMWNLAPTVRRNYVVAELIENLTLDGRVKHLRRNWAGHLKEATVLVTVQENDSMSVATFDQSGEREVTRDTISAMFDRFSLPAVEEGFDYISYQFQSEEKCAELLRAYIRSCKIEFPMASIRPSNQFVNERMRWEKRLAEMQNLQCEWKRKKPDIEVPDDIGTDEVLDIENAYEGAPLYTNFETEDWVLLNFRAHVHMILLAFKRDIDDPDRQNLHHKNFSFYYAVFFGKKFEATNFSQASMNEVFDLISDTVSLSSSSGLLLPVFKEDVQWDEFVKLAYAERNTRLNMYAAGDENALLRFPRPQTDSMLSPSTHDGRQAGGLVGKAASVAAWVRAASLSSPQSLFGAGFGQGPRNEIQAAINRTISFPIAKAGLKVPCAPGPAVMKSLSPPIVVPPRDDLPSPTMVKSPCAPTVVPPREDLFRGRVFSGVVYAHSKSSQAQLCCVKCDATHQLFGQDLFLPHFDLVLHKLSHGSTVNFTVELTPQKEPYAKIVATADGEAEKASTNNTNGTADGIREGSGDGISFSPLQPENQKMLEEINKKRIDAHLKKTGMTNIADKGESTDGSHKSVGVPNGAKSVVGTSHGTRERHARGNGISALQTENRKKMEEMNTKRVEQHHDKTSVKNIADKGEFAVGSHKLAELPKRNDERGKGDGKSQRATATRDEAKSDKRRSGKGGGKSQRATATRAEAKLDKGRRRRFRDGVRAAARKAQEPPPILETPLLHYSVGYGPLAQPPPAVSAPPTMSAPPAPLAPAPAPYGYGPFASAPLPTSAPAAPIAAAQAPPIGYGPLAPSSTSPAPAPPAPNASDLAPSVGYRPLASASAPAPQAPSAPPLTSAPPPPAPPPAPSSGYGPFAPAPAPTPPAPSAPPPSSAPPPCFAPSYALDASAPYALEDPAMAQPNKPRPPMEPPPPDLFKLQAAFRPEPQNPPAPSSGRSKSVYEVDPPRQPPWKREHQYLQSGGAQDPDIKKMRGSVGAMFAACSSQSGSAHQAADTPARPKPSRKKGL